MSEARKGFCCTDMLYHSTLRCQAHKYFPEACPDLMVTWSAQHGPGLPISPGAGGGQIRIRYCPWCGSDLPRPAAVPGPAGDQS